MIVFTLYGAETWNFNSTEEYIIGFQWNCLNTVQEKYTKRFNVFTQGEDGVRQVLQILKDEFSSDMALAGRCISFSSSEYVGILFIIAISNCLRKIRSFVSRTRDNCCWRELLIQVVWHHYSCRPWLCFETARFDLPLPASSRIPLFSKPK